MAIDPVRNFGKVTVSTGYAAGETSIVLSGGDGAKLPNPTTEGAFNLVWWNNTDYATPEDDPNVEIIRVVGISTDTLTVVRDQEGTTDNNHNTGSKTYKMINALTKAVMDAIRNLVTDHDLLSHLAWTVAGHTIDTDFPIGAFAVLLSEIATTTNPGINDLKIYAKDVSSITHLFTKDSVGTEDDLSDHTWAKIDKTTSSIADITSHSHTLLTDKGTTTHANIDIFINTTVPNTYVPYTGATAGLNLGAFDLDVTNVRAQEVDSYSYVLIGATSHAGVSISPDANTAAYDMWLPNDHPVSDSLIKVASTGVWTWDTSVFAHLASTSNPHSVTKTQVSLGSVDNVQQLPMSYLDTDPTFAANSDSKVASQKATKTYVDAFALGIKYKTAVKAATVTAGTLATDFENGDVIDDVTLVTNDRILIKNQVAPEENGIYTVNASGAPTRATDADTAPEITQGVTVPVLVGGTANGGTLWVQTLVVTTINVDPILFSELPPPDITTASLGVKKVLLDFQLDFVANDGLKLVSVNSITVAYDNSSIGIVSNNLAVKTGGITNTMLAGSIADSKLLTISTASKVDWVAVNKTGSVWNNLGNVNTTATNYFVPYYDTGTSKWISALLTDNNIAAAAGIVDTKLATISTAGKVSGAALTSLTSIPSGAGKIPMANLATGTPNGLQFVRDDGVLATPTGMSWVEVTGTSQSAVINTGYICNNAGLVTVTLPPYAAVGSVIRIAGKGTGGWKVAQNASGKIYFGNQNTTPGTGGSLASVNLHDTVELLCIVTDNEWLVLSSIGNITMV